jgi:PAS domain-containing protein
MPQIVWTSKPDGELDYYNPRWVDYTGMTAEQTAGWGWGPVLHPDDLQLCVDRWRSLSFRSRSRRRRWPEKCATRSTLIRRLGALRAIRPNTFAARQLAF